MSLQTRLLGIISDLCLWIVAAALLWATWAWLTAGPLKFLFHSGQVVHLNFQDASQLTTGSPVHFMGTDIGYVSHVKPSGYEVEVTFETYPDTIEIPPGSHFTIQFNSLAGAKTLEITPPKRPYPSQAGYQVENPIRMRDVMNTQMVLAKALEDSSNNLAQSLGEDLDQSWFQSTLARTNDTMREVRNQMRQSLIRIDREADRLHQFEVRAFPFIRSTTFAAQSLDALTRPEFFKSQTMTSAGYLARGTEHTYQKLVQIQQDHQPEYWHLKAADRTEQMSQLRGRVLSQSSRFWPRWETLNHWGRQTYQRLTRQFEPRAIRSRLSQLRLQTLDWAQRTSLWATSQKKPVKKLSPKLDSSVP